MDCPAEERLVRTALEGREGVAELRFDLPERRLTVIHVGSADVVRETVARLNLGAEVIATETVSEADIAATPAGPGERRTLKIALAINGGMFVAEIIGAVVAQSSALLADSCCSLSAPSEKSRGVSCSAANPSRSSSRLLPGPRWSQTPRRCG